MQRADTLLRARDLLTAMYSADVSGVATLAHWLSELAKEESLTDLAEAAIEVEHEVKRGRPISLVQPLNKLSAELQKVQARELAH